MKKKKEEKAYFTILLALLTAAVLGGCGNFHWRGKIAEYEEQLYTCSESTEIHDIVIDNNDVPVEIYNSPNEEMYFSYYLADDESNRYEIEEKDGGLKVSNICEQNYGIFVFGDDYTSKSYENVKLQLFIPCGYLGSLSIKTLDGNICIHDIMAENIEIETSDGNVLFEGTDVHESLYCKTQDGNIKGILAGLRSEYNFKMKSSNGESSINSSAKSNKTIEIVTDDGDIEVSFSESK